jgi:DNA-directed RNA polymerase subunit RPC12/RpoP
MRWLPLATIAILTPGGSILTRDVGTIRMKLQDYRIEGTAIRDSHSLDRFVRSIKRDMLILFPVTILLYTAGTMTDSQPILTASYVSFALIFLVFIARLVHLRSTSNISGCPTCGEPMTRETQNQTTYVVCHRCQAIFFAFRPSEDPDRIHDEVDIAQSLKGEQ